MLQSSMVNYNYLYTIGLGLPMFLNDNNRYRKERSPLISPITEYRHSFIKYNIGRYILKIYATKKVGMFCVILGYDIRFIIYTLYR